MGLDRRSSWWAWMKGLFVNPTWTALLEGLHGKPGLQAYLAPHSLLPKQKTEVN